MKRSASVTVAAVALLIVSTLSLIFGSFGLIDMLMASRLGSHGALPPVVLAMGVIVMAIWVCASGFGVAAGVGLIGLRNWARISTLIIAGALAFFGVCGIPVIFAMPSMPNAPEGVLTALRWVLGAVYFALLALGVWWLVLFNRKSVKAQFVGAVAAETPSLGGPGVGVPVAEQHVRGPLAITIVAWIMAVFAPFALVPLFLHMPVLLFGRLLRGPSATAFILTMGAAQLIAAVGVLKLKEWAHSLMLGLQALWLASGVAAILDPNIEVRMRELTQEMFSRYMPNMPSVAFPMNIRANMAIGLLFPTIVIFLLVYYREQFYEAARRTGSRT